MRVLHVIRDLNFASGGVNGSEAEDSGEEGDGGAHRGYDLLNGPSESQGTPGNDRVSRGRRRCIQRRRAAQGAKRAVQRKC